MALRGATERNSWNKLFDGLKITKPPCEWVCSDIFNLLIAAMAFNYPNVETITIMCSPLLEPTGRIVINVGLQESSLPYSYPFSQIPFTNTIKATESYCGIIVRHYLWMTENSRPFWPPPPLVHNIQIWHHCYLYCNLLNIAKFRVRVP